MVYFLSKTKGDPKLPKRIVASFDKPKRTPQSLFTIILPVSEEQVLEYACAVSSTIQSILSQMMFVVCN